MEFLSELPRNIYQEKSRDRSVVKIPIIIPFSSENLVKHEDVSCLMIIPFILITYVSAEIQYNVLYFKRVNT